MRLGESFSFNLKKIKFFASLELKSIIFFMQILLFNEFLYSKSLFILFKSNLLVFPLN